ncbi:MAG: alpha/beta fold hydrolase [Spirulina sp. SIO3F2]|nr:alpha/beta fold hydrolase [Spirulina sp. SIO3F2]
MKSAPSSPSSGRQTLHPPQTWTWRGHPICYQQTGEQGPVVILIHGFGASWGHWRKNLPVLGQVARCYAIDLLGFGASAKPKPNEALPYTFETWAAQIADFCQAVAGESAFLIGNSIGAIVAMQAAVTNPQQVRGVAALNFSLRMLHERKRSALPWYEQWGAGVMQQCLRQDWFSRFFFQQLATPRTVRRVLHQAYQRSEAVTDELVELLLKPARDPGAVAVFTAFTTYSQGPLAEDLLPQLQCPTIVLWGADDPWEAIALGRTIADVPTVDEFIELPGLGHCPQDEAPEVVNPLLQQWLTQHTATSLAPLE